MAKKDKKAAGSKKADRKFQKQSEEIKALSGALKDFRKQNDRLANRVRELEKDDTLADRLKSLERDYRKSAKRVESLERELKETKSTVTLLKRGSGAKKSAPKGGKPKRPGEESEPVITKAARKKASETGLDLSNVKGTGVEGRVTVRDVRKAHRAAKPGKSRKKAKR